MTEPRYRVTLKRDPEDERPIWLAFANHDHRIHTWGRSIEEAQDNALEVLALWEDLDDDESIDPDLVEWHIQLPTGSEPVDVAPAVTNLVRLRQRLRRLDQLTNELVERTVNGLHRSGLSYREVGHLLGLSRQRVHQLADGGEGSEALAAEEPGGYSAWQDLSRSIETIGAALEAVPEHEHDVEDA